MNISLILLKDQFYLSPGRKGNGDFFFLGGGVTSFLGGMKGGRKDQSSPTVYKGDYSLYLSPGRGGREDQSSPIEYKGV